MICVFLGDTVWLKINICSTEYLRMLDGLRTFWYFLCGGKKIICSTQNQKETSTKLIFSLYSLPQVPTRMTERNLQESTSPTLTTIVS